MVKFKLILQITLLLSVLFSMGVEIAYAVDLVAYEEFNETDTENETSEYKGLAHDKTTANHTFYRYFTSQEKDMARNYLYQALIGSDFSKNHLVPPDKPSCHKTTES